MSKPSKYALDLAKLDDSQRAEYRKLCFKYRDRFGTHYLLPNMPKRRLEITLHSDHVYINEMIYMKDHPVLTLPTLKKHLAIHLMTN